MWHAEQNYEANFALKISSSRVWSIQTYLPLSCPKIPHLVMKMAAEQHCDPPFSSFGADCPLLFTAPLFLNFCLRCFIKVELKTFPYLLLRGCTLFAAHRRCLTLQNLTGIKTLHSHTAKAGDAENTSCIINAITLWASLSVNSRHVGNLSTRDKTDTSSRRRCRVTLLLVNIIGCPSIFFHCLLAGVKACLQAGTWMPEAEHEAGEGPQRSRINRCSLVTEAQSPEVDEQTCLDWKLCPAHITCVF